MNKANLKSYAPKARLDFIKAVTERANVLGISASGVVAAEVRGDVALIDGREWPAKVAGQRDELITRIKRHGFEQTMDEVAYTWFNRFAALRYMEIHDYLGHGWRVLSSRDGGLPEILRHASEVTLPGLNPDRAREMQLAGNQDNELYKLLLVAQCNELSRVMPFLFERIDDETELLLPENLLRTDSIVAKLVEQVPEEDWQEIEVIGWLYQFYISEKKDQVIGKVVKSEDIPAATQLFTPNWIVQYLVQNSVGRLWLMANPTSTLASQWPYYIQPAEQTPEVQAQLDALIQTRIREDGETLNPETITVLDPACGSGHILVVAYDVLKAIYLERGYQPRSIPRLILEKNLYGLDIDARAAQLTAFALMMKARADDRRLLLEPPNLNVLCLGSSAGLDVEELSTHLGRFGITRRTIKELVDSFANAKTFGSMIQTSAALNELDGKFATALKQALESGDLYARQAASDLLPLVFQCAVLGARFDIVAANPPYMGSKNMTPEIKRYAADRFPESKPDLFSMFMERATELIRDSGFCALVTMQSWMFLSSFESFRKSFVGANAVHVLAHLGSRAFPELTGQAVQVAAFVTSRLKHSKFRPLFIKADFGNEEEKAATLASGSARYSNYTNFELSKIPGNRLAYWITKQQAATFDADLCLEDVLGPRQGMATSDNGRFLRFWWEVSANSVSRTSPNRESAKSTGCRWFPYNKGGTPRRWYGNQEYVVDWADDGKRLLSYAADLYGSPTRTIKNISSYFRESLTWGDITFKNNKGEESFAARYSPPGAIFDVAGPSGFPPSADMMPILCLLNSKVVRAYMSVFNPTAHFQVGDMKQIPYILGQDSKRKLQPLAARAVEIAREDYEADENCPTFSRPRVKSSKSTLRASFDFAQKMAKERVSELSSIEEEINRILINEYGLSGQLDAEVGPQDVTLPVHDRATHAIAIVSWAIGCLLGRYSLEEPGLIYAHAGGVGFDSSRFGEEFPADTDGIVPITDESWFEDDAARKLHDFVSAVWGADALEEDLAWLAESLGTKGAETPIETIRRYLADKFFKDHLQSYRKRPIYWLFTSGKQGAFQALVYLHRYNEGTLARMRAEYVVPLIAKMVSRLDMLDKDVAAASSTAARTKLQKQIESLRKKQIELLAYDEKLRHYADMRISLDLDDGVKVNYAKFGDLVGEPKAITGGSDE